MADELKDALSNKTQTAEAPKPDEAGQRISQLTDTLKAETAAKSAAETAAAAAEKRAADAEAELAFAKLPAELGKASEHKDEIKQLATEKGLSIEDAATVVLRKNGKLERSNDTADLGGSTVQPVRQQTNKPATTQDERAIRLNELAKEGKLGEVLLEFRG